jgi:membrane protease YdiL (CAAX protease family)
MNAPARRHRHRPAGPSRPTRPQADGIVPPPPTKTLGAEVATVLGLSLGASAVYSILALLDRLTRAQPLAAQTASLNTAEVANPALDALYQVAGAGLGVVPVFLALYLLTNVRPPDPARRAARRIGLASRRPLADLGWSAALAGVIGLPGLGLYLVGRAAGLTAHISTQSLGGYWWTVPLLVLAALKNGLLEEVVAVAYLGERLTQIGWRPWMWIGASALLRGSYHLYQGIGPFFGNVAMGLVFAWFYHRTRRVAPLVGAHTLIDVVAFTGPMVFSPSWLT